MRKLLSKIGDILKKIRREKDDDLQIPIDTSPGLFVQDRAKSDLKEDFYVENVKK